MIALDFGTTNCCAAVERPTTDEVTSVSMAPNQTDPYDAIMASSVLFASEESHVGVTAQQLYRTMSEGEQNDATYLNSFKLYLDERRLKRKRRVRKAGKTYYDGLQQIDVTPELEVSEWTDGDYSRDEVVNAVSALIGTALLAAKEQGGTDERIALGIPVHFSSRARKRLLTGLYRTGLFEGPRDLLSRVSFVLEPLAAAAAGMREAFDADDRETVLIFDHGGGTLDLSLIEFERIDGIPLPRRELAAEGSGQVAGIEIDRAFRDELSESRDIRQALQALRPLEADLYVRAAKENLSSSEHAELTLPGESFSMGIVYFANPSTRPGGSR